MPERFEILTAAFYLFVQAKRRPLAFVWLMVWSLVLIAVIFAGFYVVLEFLQTADFEAGQAPPGELTRAFAAIPILILTVLVVLLVFYTAWNRFLVGNRLPALIPFRLGADEGRFIVIAIAHWALMLGAYIVAIVPLLLIMIAITAAMAASGVDLESSALPLAAPLILYPVILFGALALSVKFMPAYPMTIREKRIVIFDSWAATKGVFWSAFVAALIPQLILIGLQIVFVAVQVSVIRLSGDTGLSAEAVPAFDPANAAQITLFVASLLAFAIPWVLMMLMPLGPYAYMAVWHDQNRAYREPQMAPLLVPSGRGEGES